MTFSLPQSRQWKTGVEISKTIGKVKPPPVASRQPPCAMLTATTTQLNSRNKNLDNYQLSQEWRACPSWKKATLPIETWNSLLKQVESKNRKVLVALLKRRLCNTFVFHRGTSTHFGANKDHTILHGSCMSSRLEPLICKPQQGRLWTLLEGPYAINYQKWQTHLKHSNKT